MFPSSIVSRIKMVAVDLDGTLLRPGGSPSPRTRRAVLAASKAGIAVVIATGRSGLNAVGVAQKIGLDAPVIACNGAHIVSASPRRDLSTTPINAGAYLELIDLLRKMAIPFRVYLSTGVTVEEQFRQKDSPASGDNLVLRDGESESLAGRALKVFLAGNKDTIRRAKQDLSRSLGDSLVFVQTLNSHGGNLLEIHDPSVDKGRAVLWLGNHLGLSREVIAAIGDGDNDISMIEAAGLGIAMANASPRLALRAKHFAFSCERDGVALFLEEVVRVQSQAKP